VDVIHIFQPFPHSCLPALFHRDLASVLIYDWDDLWWGGVFRATQKCHWRWSLTRSVIRRLEARLPAGADAVTTCSAYLRDAARIRGAAAVEVVHNGYWPAPPASSKPAARQALGLDPQAFYFGFMGRTLDEFSWCLDALAARPPEERTVRFAFCGMPPDSLDAVPAGMRSQIDYLGQLTPAQTRIFACAIDCGLLPLLDNDFNQSRFPIKFAEYLAGGAHVLASAVGEFASIAQNLPGVTLAGTTRDSWQQTLASSDWGRLTAPFSVGSESLLAQKLGWPALARQLQDFYLARLADQANRQPVLV
jgi:glycosyltransferase involved in cell wall biosynthesis